MRRLFRWPKQMLKLMDKNVIEPQHEISDNVVYLYKINLILTFMHE